MGSRSPNSICDDPGNLTLTARGSTLVQIRTTKVDPRTVRVKIFLMALTLEHRYSNESERAN